MTSDLTTLRSLMERVEQATGPDRELDALIAVALFDEKGDPEDLIYALPDQDGDCVPGSYWRVSRSGRSLRTAPPLTASVDAALALVERIRGPELGRMIIETPAPGHLATASFYDYPEEGFGSFTCQAILLALLTALIEQEDKT